MNMENMEFSQKKGCIVCGSNMTADEVERKLRILGFQSITKTQIGKNKIELDVKNIPARTVWKVIEDFPKKSFSQ